MITNDTTALICLPPIERLPGLTGIRPGLKGQLDEEGNPGKFLRASEIGLREPEERPLSTDPEKTYMFDYFVALVNGEPVPVDPYATEPENAVRGDLLVDNLQLGEFTVKSGLQIIADSAREHTLEEWAEICGIGVDDIEALAFEFTNLAHKAVADIHRGVSHHTNGFYNVYAWYTLNALIGNYDRAGGLLKSTTYKADGTKAGQPFKISTNNGTMAPFGTSIIRHNENTTSTRCSCATVIQRGATGIRCPATSIRKSFPPSAMLIHIR